MNLFLDTNALVKLYHKEKGTEKLTKFINDNSENLVLSITDVSKVEFHSVFYRKIRTGEMELSTAHEVFKLFKHDLNNFNIVEINSTVKDFAIDLLNKHASIASLRTLDSLQLTGAIFLNQMLKVDYFICSDKKLISIAKEYFLIFNPEE